MKYRKLGKIDRELSVLGFGCMRFPTIDGKIDVEKSEEMLLYGIENGVNYLDTAWPYHRMESEPFLGKFLKKYKLRDKINLVTKLPSWLVQSREDMDSYFNQQLERLQTDYFDFYLIHALNITMWENLVKNGLFDFIEEKKKSGEVKYIGFSFHDKYESYETIINGYNWDFNMIQLNFYDQEFQAGMKGYQLSKSKGIPTMIMEPLRGGKLVNHLPKDAIDIYEKSERRWSSVEWALNWVWNLDNANLLLSGMSSLDQVKENISIANRAESNVLNSDDHQTIGKVLKILKEKTKIDCTNCGYCLPCPSEVRIPLLFDKYNDAHIFENFDEAKKHYQMFIKEEHKAKNCTICGKCVSDCPQGIDIPDELENVKRLLENMED